jgi:hypothetical protein
MNGIIDHTLALGIRLESSLEFRGEEDAIWKGTIPRGMTPLIHI